MVAQRIVWNDLDKRYGLFTKRNATMVDLANGSIVQYYGANTKINVVQESVVSDVRYFRTETVAAQGLDWAFKASDFDLPIELASLEPSKKSFNNKTLQTFGTHTSPNKKLIKESETVRSEGTVSGDKKQSIIDAFKRFFRRRTK